MKKSIKMLLMVFAVAFGVMLVSGSTSKAAAAWNAGLKQTGAGANAVELSWQPYFEDEAADYYDIYIGNTATKLTYTDYTSTPSATIYKLSAGGVYYVQIVAVSASYHSADDYVELAESEVIQVATIPEVGDVETLQQTNATANSITMAWNAIAGATSYDVYRYNSWDNYVKVGENVTATSFTATGLGNSMAVSYFVIAKRATGVNGIIGQSKNFKRVDMYTVPGKITVFGLNNFWSNISVADFVWQRMNYVSGYEFELRNSSNKVLLKKDTGTTASAEVRPFKKGVFTKARVRAYITVGNTKLYGAWSDYTYNASNKSVKVIRSANRKKITVKWKKITGATGYKVSISTKEKSGFKKVKTVGKKKTSLTITKCGKKKLSKNKKYYIRVEYQTKVGKKTITSDIAGSGSI